MFSHLLHSFLFYQWKRNGKFWGMLQTIQCLREFAQEGTRIKHCLWITACHCLGVFGKVPSAPPPDSGAHSSVQMTETANRGINASLPCLVCVWGGGVRRRWGTKIKRLLWVPKPQRKSCWEPNLNWSKGSKEDSSLQLTCEHICNYTPTKLRLLGVPKCTISHATQVKTNAFLLPMQ